MVQLQHIMNQMPDIQRFLENAISNSLLERQEEEKKTREKTNCLTGSMLSGSLQSQILAILGVPPRAFSSDTLRKFERGHVVEKYIVDKMKELDLGVLLPVDIEKLRKTHPSIKSVDKTGQAVIHYTSPQEHIATGHIDIMVDMEKWGQKHMGIVPHEVKSVIDKDMIWIKKKNEPKHGHCLQAGMYAMALESEWFILHYWDFVYNQGISFVQRTEDYVDEVNSIIHEFATQMATGIVPIFEPRESWQTNPLYQDYPTWVELSQQEIMERLETEYPIAYQKLQTYKRGGE